MKFTTVVDNDGTDKSQEIIEDSLEQDLQSWFCHDISHAQDEHRR